MVTEVPKRPRLRISHGVEMDVLSQWTSTVILFEVDKQNNSTSDAVIGCQRSHFAMYGILDTLIWDNGP